MLDGVLDFLPSPVDVGQVEGHDFHDTSVHLVRHTTTTEPFSALAFKIMTNPMLVVLSSSAFIAAS